MLKASTSPGSVSAIAVCPFALLVASWRATGALVVSHWRSRERVGSLLQDAKQVSMRRGASPVVVKVKVIWEAAGEQIVGSRSCD